MILVFDLDGTISDPAEGITKSINYALDKLRLPTQNVKELTKYIGIPLKEMFDDLIEETSESVIRLAIDYYRERYFDVGFKENVLYPGIINLLEMLSESGHKLYIATSKRKDIAEEVAGFFDIRHYFNGILGCGLSRQKSELLQEIMREEKTNNLVMIGDRSHDMLAGKQESVKCIGVLWGYGSEEELRSTGADFFANSPKDILEVIKNA